jgi:hypothetical protein
MVERSTMAEPSADPMSAAINYQPSATGFFDSAALRSE